MQYNHQKLPCTALANSYKLINIIIMFHFRVRNFNFSLCLCDKIENFEVDKRKKNSSLLGLVKRTTAGIS